MKVEMIGLMGTDLTVVNAARVSFNKESDWEIEKPSIENYWEPSIRSVLSEKDEKLIKYLAKHQHWTPFGHPQITFRVSAPIFVARQLIRHTVGFVWNEVSRRYVDYEPEFYSPESWRARPENGVKQGSSDTPVTEVQIGCWDDTMPPEDLYLEAIGQCNQVYDAFIKAGICPEQARMVLPLSSYTEWYWTGSLYAFARMCRQRLGKTAQKETTFIAEEVSKHLKDLFPVSWKYLMGGITVEE